jgi:FkbH-like protein
MPAAELLAWAAHDRHRVWTFRVSDRFGDYGLCGIGSFVRNGGRAELIDFLLSCRVMGRGVEETMLQTLADDARSCGCKDLSATYVPTTRNRPCEEWLKRCRGVQLRDSVYRFDLDALRGTEGVAAQADCQ